MNFLDRFPKITQISNFINKNRLGAEVFYVWEGVGDGQARHS